MSLEEASGQTYESRDKLCRVLPYIHDHQRASIVEESLNILKNKLNHPVEVNEPQIE